MTTMGHKQIAADRGNDNRILQGGQCRDLEAMNYCFYDAISPLDGRYNALHPELYQSIHSYLSEAASISYYGKVETALAYTLSEFKIAPPDFGERVEKIVSTLSFVDVYEEEKRVQHDIRALANCIQRQLPKSHQPYVHLFATSSDIIDSARAIQYRDFLHNVLVPQIVSLLDLLYGLAGEFYNTPQVGRTHGRHAEPTTFGYWISNHATRLEGRLSLLSNASQNLIGKLSGAVGTRATITIAIENPRDFETSVLSRLGLVAATDHISTQIVQPEPMVDFMHAVTSTLGVLANIADDFRHLMRSEIDEIQEKEAKDRVGSSTMPHKINPKDFENVKSFWKTFLPRMMTCYMDQISEHQRDLTNSASQRFTNEVLAGLAHAVDRLHMAISGTKVNTLAMNKNLKESASDLTSEPLYVALALQGIPQAHDIIRRLSAAARKAGMPLIEIAASDPELAPIVEKLPDKLRKIMNEPETYIGDAAQVASEAAKRWQKERQVWLET